MADSKYYLVNLENATRPLTNEETTISNDYVTPILVSQEVIHGNTQKEERSNEYKKEVDTNMGGSDTAIKIPTSKNMRSITEFASGPVTSIPDWEPHNAFHTAKGTAHEIRIEECIVKYEVAKRRDDKGQLVIQFVWIIAPAKNNIPERTIFVGSLFAAQQKYDLSEVYIDVTPYEGGE